MGIFLRELQVRRQAEAALEAAKGSPEAVPSLAQEACANEITNVRLLAALVLKKWLPSTWQQLPMDVREKLKDGLLKRSIDGATPSPLFAKSSLDSLELRHYRLLMFYWVRLQGQGARVWRCSKFFSCMQSQKAPSARASSSASPRWR
jgi:hypothetical protein